MLAQRDDGPLEDFSTYHNVYMAFEPCGRLPSEHTTTTKLSVSMV